MRGAVARHAEAALASLSADDQDVARRILLRLVAAAVADEAPTRRRAARAELDADDDPRVERVLVALVGERLLVADDTDGRARPRGAARAVAAARALARGGRARPTSAPAAHAGGVELGGVRRASPASSTAAPGWPPRSSGPTAPGADAGLNRLEREFLQASRTAATRATRRLRALLAAALVLLVAALAAGAVALQARGTARHRATAAIAQRLGAQALVEPALDRALLLAREGVGPRRLRRRPGATCWPRCSAVPPHWPSSTAAAPASRTPRSAPTGDVLAVRGDDGSVAFFDLHTLREHGPRFQGSGKLGYCGAIGRPVQRAGAQPGRPHARRRRRGTLTGSTPTSPWSTPARIARRASRVSPRAATADVVFAPDGRRLVTGEAVTCRSSPPDEVLVARSARDGRVLGQSPPIAGGRLIGFTRDGRRLLVSSGEATSYLLDGRTLRAVAHVRRRRDGSALAGRGHSRRSAATTAPSRSSTSVPAASGRPRAARRAACSLWRSAATARCSRRAPTTAASASGTSRPGGCASASPGTPARPSRRSSAPTATTLVSGSSDGSEIVWDVLGERRLGRPFRFDPVAVRGEGGHAPAANASTAVAVSPDGRLFATSPAPGRVTLWRNRDQAVLGELRGPFGYVVSLAFSHDGRLLAATGNAPNTVVWNVATESIVRILRSPVDAGRGRRRILAVRRPRRDRRRRARRTIRVCFGSTSSQAAGCSGTSAFTGRSRTWTSAPTESC